MQSRDMSSAQRDVVSSGWRSVLARLSELSLELECLCSLERGSLPVPDFATLNPNTLEKSVKNFLVGILENHAVHPWRSRVVTLCSASRTLVGASLFLFRKVLPGQPGSTDTFSQRLSTPEDHLPPWYPAFADAIIGEVLGDAWDRHYFRNCENTVPGVSACLEQSRSKGGVRSLRRSRPDWLSKANTGCGLNVPCVARHSSVLSSGKYRDITVNPADHDLLKPLHHTLYDALSRCSWLLRGDVRPTSFKGFEPKEGEVFISGDYEGATDNLSLAATMYLAKSVLRRTRFVPRGIKQYAFDTLSLQVEIGGSFFSQRRGQMMGSYLSFPLLCLHNYVMFRSEFGRSTPVLINGDDIVFRSTKKRFERWSSLVRLAGLKLSAGKTLVSDRNFSLNSTFFRSTRSGVVLQPVIRSFTLWGIDPSGVLCTGDSLRWFLRGFRGDARERVTALFLRSKRSQVLASGRSVVAGLGWKVSPSVLSRVDLYNRERLYALCGRVEAPLPPPLGDQNWLSVPPGWRQVARRKTRALVRAQKSFLADMISVAWQGRRGAPSSSDDWWRLVRLTGITVPSLVGKSFKGPTGKLHSLNRRLWLIAGGFSSEWKQCVSGKSWVGDHFFRSEPPRKRKWWVLDGPAVAPLFFKCA